MSRFGGWLKAWPGWQRDAGVKMAWGYLGMVLAVALLGPLVANERPYRCVLDGVVYYPLFSGISEAALSVRHPRHSPVRFHETNFDAVWRAPIPYSPSTIDLRGGIYRAPGAPCGISGIARHWLGTDSLGRDVTAGMVRGCRISLLIGLGAMLLAMLVAVPLGAISAYAGNRGMRIRLGRFILLMALLATGCVVVYAPINRGWFWFFFVLAGMAAVFLFADRRPAGRWAITLPMDRLIMGMISVVDGFPGLFLVLLTMALLPVKGWLAVLVVIALIRWPALARYVRAEVLKIKSTPYIQAATLLNLPNRHILWRHIVPYALRPVWINFIFGVASAIVTESSLSFLGIGLAADELNWGRLLAQSRNHFEAWWLVVFPGGAIALTLIALHVIAEAWARNLTSGPTAGKVGTAQ